MKLEGDGYQEQAIREYNESAEAKGHDRVPTFADVDDYRDELKYNGVICEETGRKVLPCPHDACRRCCVHCADWFHDDLATCAGCGLYGPLGKTHFRKDSGEECGQYV